MRPDAPLPSSTLPRILRATAFAVTVSSIGALGVVKAQGPSQGPVAGANVNVIAGNDAAGALVFNVGTLNPGESAVITFGVTIDD